jgi:hypothetical protein
MPILDKKPLSAYKLSHMISELEFSSPVLRVVNGIVVLQIRPDKAKKAILRVLSDHYPNVWPGIPKIAKLTNYSERQVRRVLRELEFKDRLIVDVNSRYWWRWPTAEEIQNGQPNYLRSTTPRVRGVPFSRKIFKKSVK